MTKEEFKQIRKDLGMTQEEFASLLGYSDRQIILRKENGLRGISKQDEIIIDLHSKMQSIKKHIAS